MSLLCHISFHHSHGRCIIHKCVTLADKQRDKNDEGRPARGIQQDEDVTV